MILSDKEIKEEKLILDEDESNYRATSYDVSIGKIITTEGKVEEEFIIKPQGIVEVISKERVKLPKYITGYAMVKTSLCNEGILPLNIGIIDPGWEGPLSATLLNFSKKEFRLGKGKIFYGLPFMLVMRPKKLSLNQKVLNSTNKIERIRLRILHPHFLILKLILKMHLMNLLQTLKTPFGNSSHLLPSALELLQ